MRIHENGFSFFGGAQRGNAAAGQALTRRHTTDLVYPNVACPFAKYK